MPHGTSSGGFRTGSFRATGYFADPDGVRWVIAHNPCPIGESVVPH
jgi:hypothetical protein